MCSAAKLFTEFVGREVVHSLVHIVGSKFGQPLACAKPIRLRSHCDELLVVHRQVAPVGDGAAIGHKWGRVAVENAGRPVLDLQDGNRSPYVGLSVRTLSCL